MPTAQVLALLKASGPVQAASTLLAMPADRVTALLTAMKPVDLANLLLAANERQKARLLAAMSAETAAGALAAVTSDQAMTLRAMLPSNTGSAGAGERPVEHTASGRAYPPENARMGTDEAVPDNSRGGLHSTPYEQQIVSSLCRIIPGVSQLPGRTCDLLVTVFNRNVQVSVRYRGDGPLNESDLSELATAADWRTIVGLAVVSNAPPTPGAQAYASKVTAGGYPLELFRWAAESDSRSLKRLLVRLAS